MAIEILAGIILLTFLWSVIEQRLLGTTSYTISSQKLGKEFNGTAFVVLADLHNLSFGKANDKLIHRIDKLKPEFIIVAGDLITKYQKCIPGNAYSLLEDLIKKYPVYYAYGNHEKYFEQLKPSTDMGQDGGTYHALYSSWLDYKTKLSSLGVEFLDNRNITVTKGRRRLSITGFTLEPEAYHRKGTFQSGEGILKSLSGALKKEDYKILIAHNPLYFKDYIPFGYDLILSGHLHGGLMRIPFLGGVVSPQYKLFPKYSAGLIDENNQKMVVSRGLGTHSFMPRIFNRPELIHIRLKAK